MIFFRKQFILEQIYCDTRLGNKKKISFRSRSRSRKGQGPGPGQGQKAKVGQVNQYRSEIKEGSHQYYC